MSNGDDVLDNWEEIDEAGLTNTLQKIQAERKTHDQLLQQQHQLQDQQHLISAKTVVPTSATAPTDSKLFTLSNIDFPTPAAAASVPMKLLQRNANASQSAGGTGANNASSVATDLKSPLDDMAAAFQPVMMLLHKPADEYQSTTYAQPTNLQTVKILRRPTQSSEPRNNGIRPRQPIKTLQQREQEYAEARLRILGSAKNPDDDVGAVNASTNTSTTVAATAGSTTTTTTTATNTPSTYKGNNASATKVNHNVNSVANALNLHNNYYQQQQQQLQQAHYFYMQQQQQQQQQKQQQQKQQQQQLPPAYNNRTLAAGNMSPLLPLPLPNVQHQQQQTWSPVVGGSVSSPALRQQQQESILRLPRGPDGSNGFQIRR